MELGNTKPNQLSDLATEENDMVICLTESWLSDEMADTETHIEGPYIVTQTELCLSGRIYDLCQERPSHSSLLSIPK